MGQRGLIAALTALVLLIFGAILGQPGQFPVVESQAVFTPDYVFGLVGGLIAPLALLIKNFASLNKALTTRVNNPNDPFNPNDFWALLKSKEFWTYVVAAGVALCQIFGAKVISEDEQIIVVNGILALAGVLLDSWGVRPSGMRQDSAPTNLVTIRPNVDGDN